MELRPGHPSRYCCFKGCQINSDMKGVHFYRFPKDEERCKAWVKACKNEKLLSIPVKGLYMKKVLCMNHFEDWCFMNVTTKHRLVHNAIPNTKKFLVTRNVVHDNLTNIPVSNNVGHLNNTPVLNNVGCKNNTPVSNNVGHENDIPVSNSVDRQNDTPVSNNVDCQNDTPVSNNVDHQKDTLVLNNVDCQSGILEQLLTTSSTVSKVYKETQFKNNIQDKKKQATIPTNFNDPNRPIITSSGQLKKNYPKPGSLVLKTLEINNPLAPKSAQLIQITAATSNNGKTVEQESEIVNGSLLEQRKGNLSKDKKNDSSKNKEVVKEKCDSSTTEVMTYLICDVDQELTDFEKMLPIFQDNGAMDFTQNIQIKDASNNSNIMQDISLMSKVAEMESKVKKQYLEERTDMLLKISNLEKEIEGFCKRHKRDQRKIENLLKLQRQKDRKIATLKKCIANLRQQNIVSKNQDNQIYVFFKQPNISKQ